MLDASPGPLAAIVWRRCDDPVMTESDRGRSEAAQRGLFPSRYSLPKRDCHPVELDAHALFSRDGHVSDCRALVDWAQELGARSSTAT
jgi:hypothetical protein